MASSNTRSPSSICESVATKGARIRITFPNVHAEIIGNRRRWQVSEFRLPSGLILYQFDRAHCADADSNMRPMCSGALLQLKRIDGLKNSQRSGASCRIPAEGLTEPTRSGHRSN
jgi:hypothetical protein